MDKTVNTFGAELLDMCYIHKMRILNVDYDGDRESSRLCHTVGPV